MTKMFTYLIFYFFQSNLCKTKDTPKKNHLSWFFFFFSLTYVKNQSYTQKECAKKMNIT